MEVDLSFPIQKEIRVATAETKHIQMLKSKEGSEVLGMLHLQFLSTYT